MISSGMFFRTNRPTLDRALVLPLMLLAALAISCGDSEPKPAPAPSPKAEPAPAAATPEPLEAKLTGPRPKIVALGDSLTAGYGLEKSASYPMLLQRMLDERGYNYEVVNAGVSGETSAGAVRRIERALDGDVDAVVIALGGNDGLRGLPVNDLKKNLSSMVDKAKRKGAIVLLAGMEAPPYLGPEYTSAFRAAYREVATEQNVIVIPFLLEGVAGRGDLNQSDGIHPNEEGARLIAETVFKYLEPTLAK